ncbi:hypothetical protein Tco_0516689 [Tanacetum coccineum]
MPHDSPLLRVHTLGSDEGRIQPKELMELVTKLSDRVAVLENNLKQTKKTYGAAFTKLIKKVKTLEKTIKSSEEFNLLYLMIRKRILSIKGGKLIKLMKTLIFPCAEPDISTANVPVSTAGAEVSTAAESLVYLRRSEAKIKDKGKAIVEESKPTQTKTKIQQEQERLGFEEAQRLQEQFDEEERQRIASVHKEASTFKPEEWDNIQAQIEADEELAHRLQAQEREGYSESDKAKLLQLRRYSFDEIKVLFEVTVKRVNTFTPMESDDTVPKFVAGSSKRSVEEELDMLKNFDRDNLVKLWDLVRERFSLIEPTGDKERALWVELKRDRIGYFLMLVEKDYPLTRGLPMLMLVNKLQVDQHSKMADELLRKIFILANRLRH